MFIVTRIKPLIKAGRQFHGKKSQRKKRKINYTHKVPLDAAKKASSIIAKLFSMASSLIRTPMRRKSSRVRFQRFSNFTQLIIITKTLRK